MAGKQIFQAGQLKLMTQEKPNKARNVSLLVCTPASFYKGTQVPDERKCAVTTRCRSKCPGRQECGGTTLLSEGMSPMGHCPRAKLTKGRSLHPRVGSGALQHQAPNPLPRRSPPPCLKYKPRAEQLLKCSREKQCLRNWTHTLGKVWKMDGCHLRS